MLLLIDHYNDETKRIIARIRKNAPECRVLLLQETFQISDDIFTLGDYLAYGNHLSLLTPMDLYYAMMDVPEYWSVRPHQGIGGIFHEGELKGNIFFKQPLDKRFVQKVQWLHSDSSIYKTDYYSNYGKIAATDYYNNGTAIQRSYYNEHHDEVLVKDLLKGTYVSLKNGRVDSTYDSVSQLETAILHQAICNGEAILCTTKRQAMLLTCVPNWNHGKILAIPTDEASGYPAEIKQLLCPILQKAESLPKPSTDALILTDSEQMVGIKELIEAFPQIHFHIGAITAVSNFVHSLEEYANVSVYPGISAQRRQELFDQCTYYLDINHYREIADAVSMAITHNMLVLGYADTLHKPTLVCTSCVAPASDIPAFIRLWNELQQNSQSVEELLGQQTASCKRLSLEFDLTMNSWREH